MIYEKHPSYRTVSRGATLALLTMLAADYRQICPKCFTVLKLVVCDAPVSLTSLRQSYSEKSVILLLPSDTSWIIKLSFFHVRTIWRLRSIIKCSLSTDLRLQSGR